MVTQRIVLLFVLFLLSTLQGFGQRSAYIGYNTTDGLAQSQVRDIAQDHNGYLWMGTLGGLSRFDGVEFVNFSKSDGLPDNQINCLMRADDRIYIGSTGAICYVENNAIRIMRFPEGLETSRVMSMSQSAEGGLWMGLDGKGLLHWNDSTYTLYTAADGLPDAYVRALALDAKGILWVGTRQGLLWVQNGKIQEMDESTLANTSVSSLLITAGAEVFVGTFNAGVYHLQNGDINHYTTNNGLLSNDIRCIAAQEDGRVWFGSPTGMSALEGGSITRITEREGLPYANIKSFTTDREGHLWIGTDGKGVIRKAGTAFTTYTSRDGLHSDIAMGMAADSAGTIYIGSYDQGIQLLSADGFIPYPHNSDLPSATIWQMALDANGTLWAGTSNGLFRESDGTTEVYNVATGLPGNRITALALHGSGIWVGAELGMAELNLRGEIVKTYQESSGFSGKRVRSILPHGDELWIAAQGQIMHMTSGGTRSFPIDDRLETSVYCLAREESGVLWAGTSDGLFMLSPGAEAPVPVEFSNNFSARNVNFLVVLDDYSLLVGTNNGLYRINLEYFHQGEGIKAKHYTAFEGLQGNETNQNAVLIMGDEIWFGTTQGAVKFTPYNDPLGRDIAPLLSITGVQLFSTNLRLPAKADTVPVLLLGHNQNSLTFQYAGIYLSNPEKVRYRYRMQGTDAEWLGPTRSRYATYAYLPHGNYAFEVEAYTEDDPAMRTRATFGFTIKAPFYLRAWFFVLAAALLFGLIYFIVRKRVDKEKEKRANLKLQYQSRMLALETQSLNSSMNRHFIFNALNSIQYYINMQDKVLANRYLTSFARLIRKNLDSSEESQSRLTDELERITLYLDLEEMRFQGRFSYSIDIDPNIKLEAMRVPAMMLQPFLENSIWHGILPSDKPGTIAISIHKDEDACIIKISDNGIGYETSMKQKSLRSNGHVSKGMEITQNRIALFGKMTGLNYKVDGPSELRNANGEVMGTVVQIILPLKETYAIQEKKELKL